MTFYLPVLFLFVIGMQFKSIECNKLDIDGLRDVLKPVSKSCKSKTGATDAMVAGMKDGAFPKEKPLMCYLRCISTFLEGMNKQGELTVNAVLKNIDILMRQDLAALMKVIVQNCMDKVTAQPTTDPCELAYNFVVCAYNEDSSLYFLPS